MAMAELRDWQQDDDRAEVESRLRAAEEQRVQAEGRCFAAERRRLDAERRLAEVQALLDEARAAGERTRKIVIELTALAARLRASIDRAPAGTAATGGEAAVERAQMTDALAAAVERLRARVAEVKAIEPDAAEAGAATAVIAPIGARAEAPAARRPHKHSMSAIARWRNRRKQRQAA
jgi:hypothetical protein